MVVNLQIWSWSEEMFQLQIQKRREYAFPAQQKEDREIFKISTVVNPTIYIFGKIEEKCEKKLFSCNQQPDDTFIVLSTVYRRFSFLRQSQQDTFPTASVDVRTKKNIFASYFLQPISLKNLRNLLRRFRRVIFYSAILFCNLVKIYCTVFT